MKKLFSAVFILIITTSIFYSCKKKLTSVLKIEEASFAVLMNGEYQKMGEAVFAPGEDITLFLINVGEFCQDKEGFSRMEMDIEIKDSNEVVIYQESDMLGENGKMKLPEKYAGSPYAVWHSTPEVLPGTYSFELKVYDKINNAQTSISKKFILE